MHVNYVLGYVKRVKCVLWTCMGGMQWHVVPSRVSVLWRSFLSWIRLIEDWNKHEANCRRSERGEERKNLKNMARVKNEISSNFIY